MAPDGADRRIIVAVDANGADLGPAEVAAGAAIAARQGVRTLLFGPADKFGEIDAPDGLVEVVDAPVSIAKVPDPVGRRAVDQGRLDRPGRQGRRRGPRRRARLRRLHRRRARRGAAERQARAGHLPPGAGDPAARSRRPPARHAARRRRQRRGPPRAPRAVRLHGRRAGLDRPGHRAPARGAAVQRHRGDQGHAAGPGGPQAAGRARRRPRRWSTSSATRRATSSWTASPTSWSPTASPATSR